MFIPGEWEEEQILFKDETGDQKETGQIGEPQLLCFEEYNLGTEMTGGGWIQDPLWETMCYLPLHAGTDIPISRFLSLLHCRALSIPEKHLFWHRERTGFDHPINAQFSPK